ncbi:unnamed protein product [Arctia plantaginis]|uniref:CHK kinase-like domain-containing protein n=1 Tax=Arctia plantaginis TaxID=874455 RepID=A0A8S0YL18_ARCPL|nr:unnamed protein product [Arctia plantaginis]
MSKEKINKVLKDCMKALNYIKYDLKVHEVSTQGANYTSNLYKVELVPENGIETLKLFVKMACPSVKMRRTLDEWKIYATERLFYTKLVDTYRDLEDESYLDLQHRLDFCKFYACQSVPHEEMLILEDLTANNWMVYDRFQPMSWPYAKSAISVLAKFHALSFAFSTKRSDEFKKVLETLKTEMNIKSLAGYVKNAKDLALQNVKPEHKVLLEKYLNDFETKIKKVNEPIGPYVITHGVYRPSNLMHKVRQDGTVDVRIVDLQTLQGASPVVDLLYFVFTSTDEDFREQYFQKLIDLYYNELQEAMKRFNLEPDYLYSKATFDSEIKQKLPYGLTIAVFALPVATVSVQNAPKVDENMELSAFFAGKASDLYVKRLNGIVDDFVKWGLLK